MQSEMAGTVSSVDAQRSQLDNLASPTATEYTLIKPLQTLHGGAKRKSGKHQRGGSAFLAYSSYGGSKRKSGKNQRGGTGIIDIVVPAGLVYANQMYKPKGAAKLYSRSRKLRGSRRHTRNNRSARRH